MPDRDWAIVTITAAITTAINAIIGKVIAPFVAARLRQRRNAAEANNVRAEAETRRAQAKKLEAETHLLEIEGWEARVNAIVDASALVSAELWEQLRSENVGLRNQVREMRLQLEIMSETISSAMARIRMLEAEKASVDSANLKLLEQVAELRKTMGLVG